MCNNPNINSHVKKKNHHLIFLKSKPKWPIMHFNNTLMYCGLIHTLETLPIRSPKFLLVQIILPIHNVSEPWFYTQIIQDFRKHSPTACSLRTQILLHFLYKETITKIQRWIQNPSTLSVLHSPTLKDTFTHNDSIQDFSLPICSIIKS